MYLLNLKNNLIFGKEGFQKKEVLEFLSFNIGEDFSEDIISLNTGVKEGEVVKALEFFQKNLIIEKVENYERDSKNFKYYFLDNGIRNLILNDFRKFEDRDELYKLLENHIVIERIKKLRREGSERKYFFWKMPDGKELTWVEETENYLEAFEFEKEEKFSDEYISEWVNRYRYRNAGYRYIFQKEDYEWFLEEKIYKKTKFDKGNNVC